MNMLLLLLMYFIGLINCESTLDAILISSSNEKEFHAHLEGKGLLHEQENACGEGITGEFIGKIMEEGYFDIISNLIRACVANGVKIDSGVHQKANFLRKKLSEVTGLLQSVKMQKATVVSPAFEWAQSGDSLFLGVKFSHKLDAPACIDLADEKIEIKENGVLLSANCKGKNKKFHLELELYDSIDIEKSSWKVASVGRGTFTLFKKNAPSRWERLLKSNEQPRNMHYWYTIHEKYSKELDNIDKMNQKEQEEKISTEETTTEEEEQEEKPIETDEEKEKRIAKQKVEKRAKSDRKKVNKEYKKKVKGLDAEYDEKLKELEENHKKEKEKLETEKQNTKQEFLENKKAKLKQIEDGLKQALENLNEKTLYERVTSMLFGSANEEQQVETENNKKEEL